MKKVITSALIYANGPIHLGHLVEYIQTDIYARSCKLQKEDAIYICADDTHGTPIEIKAEKLNITPLALIQKFHEEHKKDFDKFYIGFDEFYSTNGENNRFIVELIYNEIKKNGYIYEKEIESTFCSHCNRFLPDRFIKGTCPFCGAVDQYGDTCEKCNATYKPQDLKDPYCIVCGEKPDLKKTKHHFFKLSAFSDRLSKFIKSSNFQSEIKNYLLNWIKDGLEDWDISRDSPYFGFKIPDSDQYFYVWFDAPIGYISSTKEFCDKNNLDWKSYWKTEDSSIYHFIGKDIIYFHFLFWPAVLMAANFSIPSHIQVHGFLTINGEKMSKSRGTFITANDFISRNGDPEYLRYYYATLLNKSSNDFSFNDDDFRTTINSNLIAKYGNLINRVASFLQKNFDGLSADSIDEEEYVKYSGLKLEFLQQIKDFEYRKAMEIFHRYTDLANKYFQDKQPWQLIKDDKTEAHIVLTTALTIIKDLTILISPVLPGYSKTISDQLGFSLDIDNIGKKLFKHKINESKIVFSKVDENFSLKKKSCLSSLNIVAGKIISVKPHEQADRLYVLEVDIGNETRHVVAGLRPFYTVEELINKNICLLANLKPATLKGEQSNGMILAATSSDKKVGVLTHNKAPGTPVRFENVEYPETFEQITIDVFKELEIFSASDYISCDDCILFAGNERVFADRNIKGIVS
ncbi:MAG TPA: methionine--tRNA ligase [Exilispira sp.]|nr:methionine--tRNA ligase [Spirochaetota bacterium]NLJ05403.1 methionine--tRNA ligase [Exilispira sp.]HQM88740.1 methionine--tRNA ligase [Exilispira sp.]